MSSTAPVLKPAEEEELGLLKKDLSEADRNARRHDHRE
jgi:hypothetical protein